MGPVVVSIVEPGTKEARYGEKIITTCVLSIILSAPVGAILITILGPKLLQNERLSNSNNENANNLENEDAIIHGKTVGTNVELRS